MNNQENKSDRYEIMEGMIYITRLLFKNIRWIGGFVVGVMFLTAVIVILIPNKYRSDASILPSGNQDSMSTLKMLAGFSNSGLDMDENSSALFPQILESNRLRDAIIDYRYTIGEGGDKEILTLREYFDDDRPERLRQALADITKIETSQETGIIHVSVTTEDPELSQQILAKTLAELENYNLNIRKSQAKESELYLDRELKNQTEKLAASEDSLQSFQSLNRDWYASNDPEILKTLGRLKRDVEINNQTYALLREQYEMARLTAQKDIPIVRILDSPSLPTLKSSPLRTVTIILSGIIAFILSFGFFIVTDAYCRATSQSSESLSSLSDQLAKAFPAVNRLLIKRKGDISKDMTLSE